MAGWGLGAGLFGVVWLAGLARYQVWIHLPLTLPGLILTIIPYILPLYSIIHLRKQILRTPNKLIFKLKFAGGDPNLQLPNEEWQVGKVGCLGASSHNKIG